MKNCIACLIYLTIIATRRKIAKLTLLYKLVNKQSILPGVPRVVHYPICAVHTHVVCHSVICSVERVSTITVLAGSLLFMYPLYMTKFGALRAS